MTLTDGTMDGEKATRTTSEADQAVLEDALSEIPDDLTRSGRCCMKPGCVFNERRPGFPGRATEDSVCGWSNPSVLEAALDGKAGRGHILQSMSMCNCKDKTVY